MLLILVVRLGNGSESFCEWMGLILIISFTLTGQSCFHNYLLPVLTQLTRDYSLLGSYRPILHLPKELSWSILQYTDPDVSLAQTDEDKMLGLDPVVTNEEGKFTALQMRLTLGSAAYATMAIREVTKTETSAYHQTILTQASEDQAYKGSVMENVVAESDVVAEEIVMASP